MCVNPSFLQEKHVLILFVFWDPPGMILNFSLVNENSSGKTRNAIEPILHIITFHNDNDNGSDNDRGNDNGSNNNTNNDDKNDSRKLMIIMI